MRAAAENLTPVTLELAASRLPSFAPEFPVDVAARRIIWGKCLERWADLHRARLRIAP